MNKRVRIKDIAERAGVSKGTVDRVLHNRGHVSPATRQKVLQAVEELGYQPNIIASALAYNRTWRIAALLPKPDDDPFWQQPRAGIDLALRSVRDYGFYADFFHFRDADTAHFQAQGRKILAGEYDAVLVAPIFDRQSRQFLDQCEARKLKYVQINTFLESEDDHFLCYIGQDSYQSGKLAAKLLNFGLSAGEAALILHLEKAVYNSSHLMEKQRGFEDFFQQHSDQRIEVIEAAFEDVFDHRGLGLFMEGLLAEHPNTKGIFVTTSRSFHLVEVLDRMNTRHIKLVGFDLIRQNLEHLQAEKIDFLINQNPLKQGYLGMINIFNHLVLKKPLKNIQFLPLDVVMPENLEYYLEDEEEEKLHLIF